MSSGKRKSKGGKKTDRSLGDVTINDFANATVCKNRAKKSTTSVTTVVKHLVVESDTRAWDEKLEEFEGDFDFVREENEDGTESVVIKRTEQPTTATTRRRTKTESDETLRNIGGNQYPLDIWFLISEHIQPEDVGRFAGICQSTLAVVYSAKFWFNLYKRFYKSVPNMPERLQPECMVRLYGLRSSVIRALYYMYPPFVDKLKSPNIQNDPHDLTKRQCILMWHEKFKSQWLFYFKLKKIDSVHMSSRRPTGPREQPDLIEMLEDVSANQDENCRVLRVTCLHYMSTPIVLGMSLASVSLTLSQGLRHQRLKLSFCSSVVCSSGGMPVDSNNSSVVVLDPVVNIRVLDWWHPQYPHSGTTATHLINQE
ncbi:transmembrane protein 183B [Chrysoperla carnea]|uniref:transmembrane protein 183B n=1 Tax=Chrysoperla carnea TaxID=189513 RepID=UPI001D078327|nr:transmembrane protein 183B [Chrysoperla carnea]